MKLLVKVICILFIILLLQIPLYMIKGESNERKSNKSFVTKEIAAGFGESQNLVTPYLRIELTKTDYTTVDNITTPPTRAKYYLFVPPTTVSVDGDINVETKNRRIYSLNVFSTKFEISGVFKISDEYKIYLKRNDVSVDSINFVLSVSDLKGFRTIPTGTIGDNKLYFQARQRGVGKVELVSSVPKSILSGQHDFSLSLNLSGSSQIKIYPTGLENDVNITGNWPHPSFIGDILPETRVVDNAGFKAKWLSTSLTGQRLLNSDMLVDAAKAGDSVLFDFAFGINFVDVVDIYSLVDRSIKYGFLIISLTFLVIFVAEMVGKSRVHPVQYALTGFALVVFFLLLLALSEHISFGLAYLAAAVACLALIAFYIYFGLKSVKSTAIFSGFLALSYSALYLLLNVSDFALLVGSIFVFVALAAVMAVTRKLNWYDVKG